MKFKISETQNLNKKIQTKNKQLKQKIQKIQNKKITKIKTILLVTKFVCSARAD